MARQPKPLSKAAQEVLAALETIKAYADIEQYLQVTEHGLKHIPLGDMLQWRIPIPDDLDRILFHASGILIDHLVDNRNDTHTETVYELQNASYNVRVVKKKVGHLLGGIMIPGTDWEVWYN